MTANTLTATFTAIVTFTAISAVIALLLIFFARRFAVQEDPRLDLVEQTLPNSNCGACGFAGCRQFAEALLQHKTNPGQCSVSDEEQRRQVADILQVGIGTVNQLTARLACAGGNNVARFHAHYSGLATCEAAAQVNGGAKVCQWGCLGLGDCERVCDFDAIHMSPHSLPLVREDLCTGCGDCVDICPKDLFTIHPVEHRLWVACNNPVFGDELLSYCEVACTACGRCEKDAPDLITIQNNLPVIDYTKNHRNQAPIQRCPTGAILWIGADGRCEYGKQSVKVLRNSSLQPLNS
ncbi:MAG: RnfABCDGE type electron transport complex subunit B [Gammaproteobacteria bacterium]|nr:RnfABCDGE type electron transport complex subunit B [Gammaproteobacteria bacterium]MDH5802947.1 RnfABCDGE type electron transport complex subunit B [Gammaproteobacteria bacterium]